MSEIRPPVPVAYAELLAISGNASKRLGSRHRNYCLPEEWRPYRGRATDGRTMNRHERQGCTIRRGDEVSINEVERIGFEYLL